MQSEEKQQQHEPQEYCTKTFRYSYLNTTYSSMSIEYRKSLKSYIDALF